MFTKIIILLMSLLSLISCNRQPKSGYFIEDGILKKKIYVDGILRQFITYNNDTIRHGIYKDFYPNGYLDTEGNYVNGKVDGIVKMYYEEGFGKLLKRENEFKNGKKSGYEKIYYINQQLKKISFVVEGISNGPFLEYYADGKLEYKGMMKNDISVDTSFWYYPSGQLEVFKFHDSLGKDLYRVEYDKNGNILNESGDTSFRLKELPPVQTSTWP